MMSVTPVMVAQLSLPGCARAIASRSLTEPTLSEGGTETLTRVLEMRASGDRSRRSYGILSCRYGWPTNDDEGPNKSV
jgi:hypothetical protein